MTANEDEAGFTLVELLLSMAILTVIMGAISSAMIVFLKNGAYTTQRDDHSAGSAVLGSYLDRDLVSAEVAATGVPAPCHGATKDLVLTWSEWTASPTAVMPVPGQSFAAAYDVVGNAPGPYELHRWYCTGSSLISHHVLLKDLPSTTLSTTSTGSCPAGSTPLAVRLPAFAEDTAAGYSSSACLKGRLG